MKSTKKSNIMLTPKQARIVCATLLGYMDRNAAIKRTVANGGKPLYAQADELTLDIQRALMCTGAMEAVADELDKPKKKQAKLV